MGFMARDTILAAGGIVVQTGDTPRVALVCLRKSNEWVLPKGKLDKGETPRAAAEREVIEETGFEVNVHEFLGTLSYDAIGGRPKAVHFWRMEPADKPQRELMKDVTAVVWLPLRDANTQLSRSYERAFLSQVGPLAIASAAAAVTPAPIKSQPEPWVPEHHAPRRGLLQRFWHWAASFRSRTNQT